MDHRTWDDLVSWAGHENHSPRCTEILRPCCHCARSARATHVFAGLRQRRRAYRHPSRRAHRHHLAGTLRPLHRAPRRRHLRRRLGRAGLEDPEHARHPPGLHRHHARRPGAAAALARRLLCRLLRLARRPRRGGEPPRAHRLLGPAGLQPVSACTSSCTPAAPSAASPTSPPNMRTLPARDFYQEIEYCNAPSGPVPIKLRRAAVHNALAAQRAANGDPEPFNVDLWGVGNESWGCGGNLVPEEYAAMFRRFTAWTPSFSGPPLRFVAVGPNGDDVDWTRRLFKSLYANSERRHLFGLSRPLLHLRQPHRVCRGRCAQLQLRRLLRPAHPRQHHGARRHRPLGRDGRPQKPASPRSSWSSTSGAPGTAKAPRSAPSTTSRSSPPCAMRC